MHYIESTVRNVLLPVILIPAYKPDQEILLQLIQHIKEHFKHIVVVDDGSGEDFSTLFESVAAQQIDVLYHHVNLGKGAALRTGLNYIAVHFPDTVGVVTADADGQHLAKDIARVAQALLQNPNALVLGCRCFKESETSPPLPLRSMIGNRFTRRMFRFLAGFDVSDTQTGLRGIPYTFIPALIRLRTTGYDFELDMLLLAHNARRAIQEVPIETVYYKNNASSHFNPFLDSLKIYIVFIRFSISSILTAVIDFIAFSFFMFSGAGLLWSVGLARLVAGTFNFVVNRSLVFKVLENPLQTLGKYLGCICFMGLLSYSMVQMLISVYFENVLLAKLVSETLLFVLSFLLQKNLVFGSLAPGAQEHD